VPASDESEPWSTDNDNIVRGEKITVNRDLNVSDIFCKLLYLWIKYI